MTGDAEFCEVFFEDVRVPADLMVGPPGAGWQIAMGILQHERGPVWTFTFQRKIRRSFNSWCSCTRVHPASAGLDDPLVRQQLAQSYIEVELLKLMGYRSLTHMLRTGHPGPESSLEKVIGSETDQRLQEVGDGHLRPARRAGRRSALRARLHVLALGDHHGRHERDPAQCDRAAHPGTAEIEIQRLHRRGRRGHRGLAEEFL